MLMSASASAPMKPPRIVEGPAEAEAARTQCSDKRTIRKGVELQWFGCILDCKGVQRQEPRCWWLESQRWQAAPTQVAGARVSSNVPEGPIISSDDIFGQRVVCDAGRRGGLEGEDRCAGSRNTWMCNGATTARRR